MTRNIPEAGSAIMIAIMVSVILTLLGLSYLALADQENAIAANQRDADQLMFVAETGAQMVKAWFDRPVSGPVSSPLFKFMGNWDIRNKVYYDLTQRIYDHDNDPNTADLASGDTGWQAIRTGLQVGTDPNFMTFWDKPYRGSGVAEFRGSESGPDIVLVSNSINGSTGLDFLDAVNNEVIGKKNTQEAVGRIQEIIVYAPPIIEINGVKTRFGIATVRVTAAKFRRLGEVGVAKIPQTTTGSVEVGRQVAKMVLNEVPYPGPGGPFQSCTDFKTNGAAIAIHWGEVSAKLTGSVGPGMAQLRDRTPPSIPWANVGNYITGTTLTDYVTARNSETGDTSDGLWFDPWYKLRVGTTLDNAPGGVQPFPYLPIPGDIEDDDSSLMQSSPPQCPKFDYQTWKNVALSGGQNVHYMVYAGSADSYREDGVGTAQDLKAWTNGQEGFWFFETTDRLSPDPNGANLTPAISLSGGWSSAGFIFLSGDWDSSGISSGSGANRVVIPPGEPWTDADGDSVADADEYVNLKYPTAMNGQFNIFEVGDTGNPAQTATITSTNGVTYTYTTNPSARDTQGLPFTGSVAYQGVIYAEGRFEATGNMRVFGSVVTKGGMKDSGGGQTAGCPLILFDERLIKGDWPPPELNLPRTTITFWQTDL